MKVTTYYRNRSLWRLWWSPSLWCWSLYRWPWFSSLIEQRFPTLLWPPLFNPDDLESILPSEQPHNPCFLKDGRLYGKVFFCIFNGRKKVLWICYIIGTFGITVAAFSKNWTEFQIALITAGSGISPYITLTFVLLNEISGKLKDIMKFKSY